ncbi:hypothetical protein BDY19DRAFT_998749 [Irpex rosettiformis]|uniref:Uncharacterized protein n=1 Tax=Irpex rosettiformis TaxID=378272 RepID=A0ACB8TMI9_9APHY|nr:hypothetical protein BDY19DRAFT_998749 [Irpex rosettiformis]
MDGTAQSPLLSDVGADYDNAADITITRAEPPSTIETHQALSADTVASSRSEDPSSGEASCMSSILYNGSILPVNGPEIPSPVADEDPVVVVSRPLAWARPTPPAKFSLSSYSHRRSQLEPAVYSASSGLSANPKDEFTDTLRDDVLQGLGGVEKRLSELGDQVRSHRQQWESQLEDVLKQVSALQEDVDSISISLNKVRRKQDSSLTKIKEFEDNLLAAKNSWENLEKELKGIVTRAQISLQSRRSELEKALAKIPSEESSIRTDLNKIRLAVSVLSCKVQGVETRITACENESAAHAKAFERSQNALEIHDQLPATQSAFKDTSAESSEVGICPRLPPGHTAMPRNTTRLDADIQVPGNDGGLRITDPSSGEIKLNSTTSSPLGSSSDLDSSLECSSQSGVVSSIPSSDWVEASLFDNPDETVAANLFGGNNPGETQLFDPAATVALPDPPNSVHSSIVALSPTIPDHLAECEPQHPVVHVVDNDKPDTSLQFFSRVFTSTYEAICHHCDWNTHIHTRSISVRFIGTFCDAQHAFVTLGTPGSVARRRAWAVLAVALVAAVLLILDLWHQRVTPDCIGGTCCHSQRLFVQGAPTSFFSSSPHLLKLLKHNPLTDRFSSLIRVTLMLNATGIMPAAKRINSAGGLQDFAAELLAKPTRGLILDTLEISMLSDAPIPDYALIRKCLELTPHITDLTLVLPLFIPTIHSQSTTVLTDVELPSLQLLKTNLPHTDVATFLKNTSNLNRLLFLVLQGTCVSADGCALRDVQLPGLTTLECSVGCLRHVCSPNIDHLVLHNNTPLTITSVSLHRAPPYNNNLTNLTLQFFSNDYHILDKIATFAPKLCKLRLVELLTPARNGRVPARRVWKAVNCMADSLKKLPLLEEFMLDSLDDLVGRGGRKSRRQQEGELIHGWLTGRRRPWLRIGHRIKYHPSLYRISLFYGRHAPDTQILSTWTRSSGWERVSDQSGYMADVVL